VSEEITNNDWNIIQESDKVVVVLGAGATISEMHQPSTPNVPPPSDANFLSIAEQCCKKQVDSLWDVFTKLWQGGEAYPLHHQRMEQIFAGTFLKVVQTAGNTTYGRLARELYDELVLLLRDTLYKTTGKAVPEEHLSLFRRIVDRRPASFDVISFNYDCLADRTMRIGHSEGLWVWSHQDGYGFKPTNQFYPKVESTSLLLKLHGSMNWYIPIPGKSRRTAYNANAPIYVPNPPVSYSALAWHRVQKILGHKKGRRVFPLLVPPVFEKATQISGQLGRIWDIAQTKLNQATVVIVWGYSLPVTDYHAEMLFAQGARRSKFRLIVVNLDKSALGRVTEVCGHRWNRWFFRVYHLVQALDEENS